MSRMGGGLGEDGEGTGPGVEGADFALEYDGRLCPIDFSVDARELGGVGCERGILRLPGRLAGGHWGGRVEKRGWPHLGETIGERSAGLVRREGQPGLQEDV